MPEARLQVSLELWELAVLVGWNGKWAPPVMAARVAEVARLLTEAAEKLDRLEQEGLRLLEGGSGYGDG